MIEKWIDALVDVAGGVETGTKSRKMRAYYLFKKTEFPEALTEFPCALVYPERLDTQYSDGAPCIEIWTGKVEFHLTPDTQKGAYPDVMRYFARIRNAFAAHRTLGGRVSYCVLDSPLSIEGPVVLQYGTENPHMGLIAHWVVKHDVTNEVSGILGK